MNGPLNRREFLVRLPLPDITLPLASQFTLQRIVPVQSFGMEPVKHLRFLQARFTCRWYQNCIEETIEQFTHLTEHL